MWCQGLCQCKKYKYEDGWNDALNKNRWMDNREGVDNGHKLIFP